MREGTYAKHPTQDKFMGTEYYGYEADKLHLIFSQAQKLDAIDKKFVINTLDKMSEFLLGEAFDISNVGVKGNDRTKNKYFLELISGFYIQPNYNSGNIDPSQLLKNHAFIASIESDLKKMNKIIRKSVTIDEIEELEKLQSEIKELQDTIHSLFIKIRGGFDRNNIQKEMQEKQENVVLADKSIRTNIAFLLEGIGQEFNFPKARRLLKEMPDKISNWKIIKNTEADRFAKKTGYAVFLYDGYLNQCGYASDIKEALVFDTALLATGRAKLRGHSDYCIVELELSYKKIANNDKNFNSTLLNNIEASVEKTNLENFLNQNDLKKIETLYHAYKNKLEENGLLEESKPIPTKKMKI